MDETAEPGRVLYVDDRETAVATADRLERLSDDLTVEAATDASAALDRLAGGPFDCVAYAGDGLDFVESVREVAADLPVVLVVESEREGLAGDVLARDGLDYCRERPGSAGDEVLVNRLEHAVERNRAAADRVDRLVAAVCRALVDAETRDEVERRVRDTLDDAGYTAWIGDYDPERGVVDPQVATGNASALDRIEVETDDAPAARAVETREPVVARARTTVGAVSRGGGETDPGVTMTVPLVSGETIHGVLQVCTDRTEGFGAREREALSTLGTDIADAIARVEARTRRERRQRQFRSAVEHAGHVVLITDTDGRITYVNDAFESVTGYTASEALGRRPSMLQSGEHDEAFYRDLWETISSGDTWEGEVVNERKDGTRYVIDQTIAPITGDDSDTDGFVAINRDVTSRKEHELNLAFLKRAIDQAGIGIGTYGADGYATYVNERLAEQFGTDREDLRTEHMCALDPTLDRERFSAYWDSFDDGERRIYDTHIERLDTGERRPVEVVTSRVRIDGKAYQVNTVRDAAERKRQERDLERFRSAVDHAGHSVLITDVEGRIEYVNGAFEEQSGYSAAEAIGRTPSLVRSGEHDEAFYRDLWETILDGEVWQGEVVNERKDGEEYVVDQTIAPITTDGDIDGFVAINRDVTELRAYERELEAQNDRLKEYGQTVAHDLRNPLALLDAELKQFRATVDWDAEAVDAAAVRELCENARAAVDRMETLIDDLLAMAEHGRRVLDPEPVSLESAAAAAWSQVGGDDAGLSVGDTTVDADPDRLRELLSNLFRNAVEHGGTDVHVRVEPLDFSTGFAVEDDGPGIPPDEREEVFERGFTTAADGTGFGLAIVEQIAEAHDWDVSVTEGRDGGARFEFRVDGSR
ncbi:PAS domain S-box protein [Haloplanus halophilus]|uniref:PAS domain S-box protein n=1 Tax=Haloplanus halophilus TaxID=2949993 RepID=UPI00203AEC95|nr:PAS domain S-box protein [Haloplanus sp. GDY1]